MNILPFDKRVEVLPHLVEGCSIRATERLCEVNKDTIMRLGLTVGEACHKLHNAWMRNLQATRIQIDEMWSFVKKKQKHIAEGDPLEFGDQWLFVAESVIHRAVISYQVGKRDRSTTSAFIADLGGRLLGRPTIISDGFELYKDAIEEWMGDEVDFAMLVKQYGTTVNPKTGKKGPYGYIGAEKTIITGRPDPTKISTSYVERMNLTFRMEMARLGRKTIKHSKQLRHHEAAIDLMVANYNFCRIHESIRMTPAMALGLTDHVWSIAELLQTAEELAAMGRSGEAKVAQMSGMEVQDPNTMFDPWPRDPSPGGSGRPKLTVIPGGKR